jgi:hypothetical protein
MLLHVKTGKGMDFERANSREGTFNTLPIIG